MRIKILINPLPAACETTRFFLSYYRTRAYFSEEPTKCEGLSKMRWNKSRHEKRRRKQKREDKKKPKTKKNLQQKQGVDSRHSFPHVEGGCNRCNCIVTLHFSPRVSEKREGWKWQRWVEAGSASPTSLIFEGGYFKVVESRKYTPRGWNVERTRSKIALPYIFSSLFFSQIIFLL